MTIWPELYVLASCATTLGFCTLMEACNERDERLCLHEWKDVRSTIVFFFLTLFFLIVSVAGAVCVFHDYFTNTNV